MTQQGDTTPCYKSHIHVYINIYIYMCLLVAVDDVSMKIEEGTLLYALPGKEKSLTIISLC